MINKLLFSLVFCSMLALPAFAVGRPVTDPGPGKGGASSQQKPKEPVISIKTAPKDAKGDQTTVGKNGEILVPQSAGASLPTYGAANLPQPGAEGGPLNTPEVGGGETKSAEGEEAKGAEREEAKTTGESGVATKGASGIGDSKSASSSSNPSEGGISNLGGGGGGFVGDSGPALFDFGNPAATPATPVPVPVPVVFPTTQLQALIDQSVSDAGIPGLVLAVKSQAGTWIGAAGKGDLGDAALGRAPQAMTTDTQVHLAGVTKLFTAALIMKLVEENKISLDDTVEQMLGPGSMPVGGENITVRMLLNHTSGLHDHETTQDFFDGLIFFPTLAWDPFFNILPLIQQVDFTPGTDFKEVSSDYFLLGLMAWGTSGFSDADPVENIIKTEVFDPLNLSQTTLNPSGLFDLTNPFARSYSQVGDPQFPGITDTTDWDLSFDWTNGSGVSTAQDILTFTQALFGSQLVSRESLQQMITPQSLTSAQRTLPFGYGLEVVNQDPWFGEKMYKSDGETVGAFARWLYFPDSGRTIFIAFNRDDKRFNTTPAPDPPPDAPQLDASAKADAILTGVSTILIQALAK